MAPLTTTAHDVRATAGMVWLARTRTNSVNDETRRVLKDRWLTALRITYNQQSGSGSRCMSVGGDEAFSHRAASAQP
jgi:hypothetical protein